MSRILRRPMFRGGRVDSRGTGITSGLGYQAGGRVGYQNAGFVTGGELMSTARAFPELNMFKDMKLNPNTRYKIGEGSNIRGFDVDRVASFMGTPGMQDLAFGDTYNLSAMLGADQKKDDDELIASKNPDFIPGKKEEILFEDQDYLSTGEKLAKERDAKRIQESIDARAEEKNQDIRESDFDAQEFIDKRAEEKNQDVLAVTEEADEVVGVQEDPLIPERQGLKEMADEYFKILSGETAERNKKALREARIADMSDYALQFFKGTQKEGATVGSAAAEVADYATKRPGRAEVLKEKFRTGEDRLREKGAEFAIRESMSDEKGDLAYQRQRSMLEMKLDATKDIEERRQIINQLNRLDDKAFKLKLQKQDQDFKQYLAENKPQVKGVAEKNVDALITSPKNSAKHIGMLKQFDMGVNIFDEAAKESNPLRGGGGEPLEAQTINSLGPIYYDDWGGVFINNADQEDGTYLDTTRKEIIKIVDGEVIVVGSIIMKDVKAAQN